MWDTGLDRLAEILQKLAVVLYDWQLSMRAQPGWDLAWFFNHAYLPEQRREREEHLLHAYLARLREMGVEDYSLKALREYMTISALFMLILRPPDVVSLDYSSRQSNAEFPAQYKTKF